MEFFEFKRFRTHSIARDLMDNASKNGVKQVVRVYDQLALKETLLVNVFDDVFT